MPEQSREEWQNQAWAEYRKLIDVPQGTKSAIKALVDKYERDLAAKDETLTVMRDQLELARDLHARGKRALDDMHRQRDQFLKAIDNLHSTISNRDEQVAALQAEAKGLAMAVDSARAELKAKQTDWNELAGRAHRSMEDLMQENDNLKATVAKRQDETVKGRSVEIDKLHARLDAIVELAMAEL